MTYFETNNKNFNMQFMVEPWTWNQNKQYRGCTNVEFSNIDKNSLCPKM
jgi:hypothetical protein